MRGGGGGRPRAGALLWQRAAAAQPRPSPRQGTGRRPPGGSPQPEGWGQAAVRVPPNGGVVVVPVAFYLKSQLKLIWEGNNNEGNQEIYIYILRYRYFSVAISAHHREVLLFGNWLCLLGNLRKMLP